PVTNCTIEIHGDNDRNPYTVPSDSLLGTETVPVNVSTPTERDFVFHGALPRFVFVKITDQYGHIRYSDSVPPITRSVLVPDTHKGGISPGLVLPGNYAIVAYLPTFENPHNEDEIPRFGLSTTHSG